MAWRRQRCQLQDAEEWSIQLHSLCTSLHQEKPHSRGKRFQTFVTQRKWVIYSMTNSLFPGKLSWRRVKADRENYSHRRNWGKKATFPWWDLEVQWTISKTEPRPYLSRTARPLHPPALGSSRQSRTQCWSREPGHPTQPWRGSTSWVPSLYQQICSSLGRFVSNCQATPYKGENLALCCSSVV